MMFLEEGQQPMTEEVSWLNHAVTATLAALGGFAVMVGGAIARLWRHEERIKALEDGRTTNATAIDALAAKVDDHHASTAERIDTMGAEIRADLRVIMSRCLTVDHSRHE